MIIQMVLQIVIIYILYYTTIDVHNVTQMHFKITLILLVLISIPEVEIFPIILVMEAVATLHGWPDAGRCPVSAPTDRSRWGMAGRGLSAVARPAHGLKESLPELNRHDVVEDWVDHWADKVEDAGEAEEERLAWVVETRSVGEEKTL